MKLREVMKNEKLMVILVFMFWIAFFTYLFAHCNGCATIQAGGFSYTRIGNQHIEGRVVTPEGWIIELNQNSKVEALEQALRILGSVQ